MSQIVKNRRKESSLYRSHEIIARNIKMLRLINGYTQDTLADVLHMSRSAYFALENNYKKVDLECLFHLSEFYDISPDYLISFDITEQMMAIFSNRNTMKAETFIENYFKLSHTGKLLVRDQIMRLKGLEDSFRQLSQSYVSEREVCRL